jgi:hypothetical protein
MKNKKSANRKEEQNKRTEKEEIRRTKQENEEENKQGLRKQYWNLGRTQIQNDTAGKVQGEVGRHQL